MLGKLSKICFAGIGMIALFCGCVAWEPSHNKFVRYAIELDLEKGKNPGDDNQSIFDAIALKKLPDDVYRDALRLQQRDRRIFYLTAALIMSKYHNQCRLVYKSGHTLLENPDDVFGDYLIDGNTKYFVVKSFAEAVTGNKRTREMVENDNFHSIEYEAWIASSTCAWLYFVNENKGADPLEKALGQAWITDRDVIELKYWGKASQGNYLGVGRLQYEECFLDTDH